MEDSDEENEAEEDDADPLEAERKRRARNQDLLRRRAGEPEKPVVKEILKLNEQFLVRLRNVLAL